LLHVKGQMELACIEAQVKLASVEGTNTSAGWGFDSGCF